MQATIRSLEARFRRYEEIDYLEIQRKVVDWVVLDN